MSKKNMQVQIKAGRLSRTECQRIQHPIHVMPMPLPSAGNQKVQQAHFVLNRLNAASAISAALGTLPPAERGIAHDLLRSLFAPGPPLQAIENRKYEGGECQAQLSAERLAALAARGCAVPANQGTVVKR